MASRPVLLAMATVSLSICGCLDQAADRTLTLHQMQSTDTYPGPFEIDTSQLPAGAIQSRSIDRGQGLTTLTIKQGYSVRVVLVPAKGKEGDDEASKVSDSSKNNE